MGPSGWLADRLGPRLVLAAMGVGTTLFTALTAAVGMFQPAYSTTTRLVLMIVRLGLGVFAAPLYPASAQAITRWVPPRTRARAQGLVIAGAPLGGAIAPLIFVPVISAHGWRASFLLAAALTGGATAAWILMTRLWMRSTSSAQEPGATNAIPDDPVGDGRRSWKPGAQRRVWMLALGYLAINYFEYLFFYWIYYYLGTIRGLSRTESAVYTTVLYLTMAAMMPAGGWLSDRLIPRFGAASSRRMVAVGGMCLSAPLLYLATGISDDRAMLATLSLALGFVASTEGPFWAAAIEIAGSERAGAAGGIMNSVGNVGGLLAPILTPAIAARAGWAASLQFACLVILAGACTWLVPRQRQNTEVTTVNSDEGGVAGARRT